MPNGVFYHRLWPTIMREKGGGGVKKYSKIFSKSVDIVLNLDYTLFTVSTEAATQPGAIHHGKQKRISKKYPETSRYNRH